VRVAAEKVAIGLTFVGLGLHPGIDVTVVLQRYCNSVTVACVGVTVVLQWCYSGVAAEKAAIGLTFVGLGLHPGIDVTVVKWCYSRVTVVLWWCCRDTTIVLQLRVLMLQWCYSGVTVDVCWSRTPVWYLI
jgi:hypothetical protein